MKFISIVFAIAFLVAACNEKKENISIEQEKHVDSLKVFSLKAEKLEKHLSLPGELFSNEKVEVRSKLTGYIKQLKVDIGSAVRKGQVLAIIDAPEIQSQLGEGTGRMNAAKAKYETSLDTYNRIVEASKTAGVISANELHKAKSQMLSDSSDYQAQKFSNESFKQFGKYLAITAPFNGVISQRNVDEGSYVGNPSDKPILVIEDNSKLRLRVAIPETLTGVSLKENKVKFTTRSYPNKIFEASLVRKSGSIDVTTRTEIWEFEVENKTENLKAGAFANVTLNILREQPTFFVPFSAVVTTLEKKFVIKVANDSTKWIDVSPGLNLAEKVEIFGPLNEGDKLVLKANEEIKSNEKVVTKF